MYKAKKTRKEIDREIALTGTYTPDFGTGDHLVSLRLKSLNKIKKPNILEVVRVVMPFGGMGEPAYRLWSSVDGKHKSELCSIIDLKYRKMASLEAAVFLD